MRKIALLIPMLSSDNENEVVGTVRAIERRLKSAGLDLHWLAKQIEGQKADLRGPRRVLQGARHHRASLDRLIYVASANDVAQISFEARLANRS